MKIKFTVQGDHLNSAIETAKIVTPRAVKQTKEAGYLFSIRSNKDGYIYSMDSNHMTRAHMEVTNVDGEGPFMYPHETIGAFKYFSGRPIEFTATKEGDQFNVQYDAGRGAGGSKPSFDPKYMQVFDKALNDAKEVGRLPAAILAEALRQSDKFHATLDNARAEEHHKMVQLFDKDAEADDPKTPGQKWKPYEKGDGVLYAANGSQAFYFDCEAFQGKSFAVHAQHHSLLLSFLDKITGIVIVKSTDRQTFVVNEDQSRVFGWTRIQEDKLHSKYSYYGLGGDKVILHVPKDDMLDALGHIGVEMEGKDKVQLHWNDTTETLQLEAAEGNAKGVRSVFVQAKTDPQSEKRRLSPFVNLKQLVSLFKDAKGSDVVLRIYPIEPSEKRPKGGAYLRTLDTFYLDAEGKLVSGSLPEGKQAPEGSVRCTVTRFMPSYD